MQIGSETDFAFRIPTSPSSRKGKEVAGDPSKSTRDVKVMLVTLREQLSAVLATKPARVAASSAGKIGIAKQNPRITKKKK